MKITDIKCHRLKETTLLPAIPRNLIEYTLVRVLTDEGIEGDYIIWSEVPSSRPGAVAEALRQMRPYLLGEDPLLIERHWQRLGKMWYAEKGPAFAAIDCCLWDIAGKKAGLPLYKLLGGARDKILAYASGEPPKSREEKAEQAAELRERGYRASKVHPFSMEDCRAERKAVGDEMILIHDAIFALDVPEALRVGRVLEELRFHWYEAPLPAEDIDGYAYLTKKLDIPVTVELRGDYRTYLERRAVRIFRTISDFTGGITEMRKLATLCGMYGLNFEPHSFGGTYTQAANLHCMLSITNCEFFELPLVRGKEGAFDVGVQKGLRIDSEGYVHAPEGPGLGLMLDWDVVKAGEEYCLD